MVIVAKVEGEKSMVVIERVSERVYSMCTLKKDVKVKDVRTTAKTAKESDLPRTDGNIQVDGDEWWRSMVSRKHNIEMLSSSQELSLQFLIQDTPTTEFPPNEVN